MVFAALFTFSFLAASVFATVTPGVGSEQYTLKHRGHRSTRPHKLAPSSFVAASAFDDTKLTPNWAGAAHESYPDGSFKSITGTFILPQPVMPPGADADGTYYASAWVGIDGDGCDNAIWQAGVDLIVNSTGFSYAAWLEWYPDNSWFWDNIPMDPMDPIRFTVTADTTTTGTVVVENLAKNTTTTNNVNSTAALCQRSAEWIVEDFSNGQELYPFANFQQVAFTDTTAVLTDGSTIGVEGTTPIDIVQDDKRLTNTMISGDAQMVLINYVG